MTALTTAAERARTQRVLVDQIAEDARRLEGLESEGEPLRWSLGEHVAQAYALGLTYQAIATHATIGPGRLSAYASAWRMFGELPQDERPRMADALILAGRDPATAAAIVAVAEARNVKIATVDKSKFDRVLINEVKERLKDPRIAEAVLADPDVAAQVARSVVEDADADAAISQARGKRDIRDAKHKEAVRDAVDIIAPDTTKKEEVSTWLATLGRLSAARRALRKAFETVEPSALDDDSRADLLTWADDVIVAAQNFKTYVTAGDTGSIDKALAALLGE